jgi:hypothetical protein
MGGRLATELLLWYRFSTDVSCSVADTYLLFFEKKERSSGR